MPLFGTAEMCSHVTSQGKNRIEQQVPTSMDADQILSRVSYNAFQS